MTNIKYNMHKILYAYYTSPYTASHLSYLLLSCLYTRILKGVHIPVVEVRHDFPPYLQHLIVVPKHQHRVIFWDLLLIERL